MELLAHDTMGALPRMSRLKRYALIRDRLRAAIGLGEHRSAASVARDLGRSHQWALNGGHRYDSQGVEGL